ncbi:hypothetical protein TIFTF001_031107 [Ficus carica]|uniref:Uncharacterized protein n=1 Tax=Ficus carica TaxID=3494 RepID=A0AA88J3S7_FICCA|nr:hypothetical protein TIFTF001_031107 [Ficus carica]
MQELWEFPNDSEMIGDDFEMISMWSEMMFDELGGYQ